MVNKIWKGNFINICLICFMNRMKIKKKKQFKKKRKQKQKKIKKNKLMDNNQFQMQ